jgi:hypothetical protein
MPLEYNIVDHYEATLFAGNANYGTGNSIGQGTNASFKFPSQLAYSKQGNLFLLDVGNYHIKKIDPLGNVTIFAGNGSSTTQVTGGESLSNVKFSNLQSLALCAGDESKLYVTATRPNSWTNNLYYTYDLVLVEQGANMVTILKTEITYWSGRNYGLTCFQDLFLTDDAYHALFRLKLLDNYSSEIFISRIDNTGNWNYKGWVDGPISSAKLESPKGIVADSKGNLFLVDSYMIDSGGNRLIRKMDMASKQVSTFVGGQGSRAFGIADGSGSQATFKDLYAIGIDSSDVLYVADNLVGKINLRQISPDGEVKTIPILLGSNQNSLPSSTPDVRGIAVNNSGEIYLSCSNWNVILKLTPHYTTIIK